MCKRERRHTADVTVGFFVLKLMGYPSWGLDELDYRMGEKTIKSDLIIV